MEDQIFFLAYFRMQLFSLCPKLYVNAVQWGPFPRRRTETTTRKGTFEQDVGGFTPNTLCGVNGDDATQTMSSLCHNIEKYPVDSFLEEVSPYVPIFH